MVISAVKKATRATEVGHGDDGSRQGHEGNGTGLPRRSFVAQAGSKWTCISAGPILHWMIGKPYHEVSRYIERKGWRVIWG
ncbi:MAG: hypothetical protein M5R42_21465 [Rhodocyclaceae bacterium]|nr:hypothetical protein [Rhodocyclaceae bacterium]